MFSLVRAPLIAFTLAVAASGCIPEAPEEKPFDATMPASDDTGDVISVAEPAETPGFSKIDMTLDAQSSSNAGVEVVTVPGQPGVQLRGSYGMRGSITPVEDSPGSWKFEAKFVFPSTGYSVSEPFVSVLDNMVITPDSTTIQDGTGDMVIVSIPIRSPGKDDAVTKGDTEVSTGLTFEAPDKAQFAAVLISG